MFCGTKACDSYCIFMPNMQYDIQTMRFVLNSATFNSPPLVTAYIPSRSETATQSNFHRPPSHYYSGKNSFLFSVKKAIPLSSIQPLQ